MMKHICRKLFLVTSPLLFDSCTSSGCEKLESMMFLKKDIYHIDYILRKNNRSCNAVYRISFSDSGASIKSSKMSERFKDKYFCHSSEKDINELNELSKKMKGNFITFAFQKKGEYLYNYSYCNQSNEFKYLKYIIIDHERAMTGLINEYRVIDRKNGLILISPRNLYGRQD